MENGQTLANSIMPIINHWAYLVIFISTILEAMPFGFVVPGHIIVIFGGFLASIKILNIFITILAAAAGMVIGDWINFYIGKHYGFAFIKKLGQYITFHAYVLEKIKMLVNEHPAKTLIIGRFNMITRSFAPFMAGVVSMDTKKFFKLSAIGGFFWAAASVMIGYLFGSGYAIAARHIGNATFFAVTILVLALFLYKYINRRERKFTSRHLFYIIINFFSLYIFFKILEDILTSESAAHFDLFVIDNISRFWTPLSSQFMVIATVLLSPELLLGLSVFMLILFLAKKDLHKFWLLSWSLIAGSLIGQLIKMAVHRARPEHGLVGAMNFSFPSAHALTAVIFFGAIIYFYKNKICSRLGRWLFVIMNIFFIILSGFSRIYLNVHRLSDVIAGYALGIFCLTVIILIFDYISNIKYGDEKSD